MKVPWASARLRPAASCSCVPKGVQARPVFPPRLQSFSTTTCWREAARKYRGIAAAEYSFEELGVGLNREPGTRLPRPIQPDRLLGTASDNYGDKKTVFARVVPASPAYYFRKPIFITELTLAKDLVRRYAKLPTCKPGTERRVVWMRSKDFTAATHEVVSDSKFDRMIYALRRLNKILPSVRPKIVEEAISKWATDFDPVLATTKIPKPDRYGRTNASGGRKTAEATVILVEGTGEFYVNGKPLTEFFGRVHDRESVVWSLKWTNRLHRYNLWATVQGGGTTGQAEALALAVGKSLVGQEPALKRWVRKGIFTPSHPYPVTHSLTCRSRMSLARSQKGRAEEARTRQGAKEAGLGQALRHSAFRIPPCIWSCRCCL